NAAFATTVLSIPPEKATAHGPTSRITASRRSRFSIRPDDSAPFADIPTPPDDTLHHTRRHTPAPIPCPSDSMPPPPHAPFGRPPPPSSGIIRRKPFSFGQLWRQPVHGHGTCTQGPVTNPRRGTHERRDPVRGVDHEDHPVARPHRHQALRGRGED